MIVNYFDSYSVEAVAAARREKFMAEAEEYRRSRDLGKKHGRKDSGNSIRRVIGFGLIRAGERISGARAGSFGSAAAA